MQVFSLTDVEPAIAAGGQVRRIADLVELHELLVV
jgi:hypothetical protein